MDVLLYVLFVEGAIIWILGLFAFFLMCFKWIHETHKRRFQMDEVLWTLDMIIEIVCKFGLIGVIYKYLTKGEK